MGTGEVGLVACAVLVFPCIPPHVCLMPMSPTPSIPVFLATLLISAMSASPASPHQLVSLLPLFFPLTSPWTHPVKEPFQRLTMCPVSPSISPLHHDPDSPGGCGLSALIPGVDFTDSDLRVAPGPSSLYDFLGSSPKPCVPPSPRFIDHPACSPTGAHLGPAAPFFLAGVAKSRLAIRPCYSLRPHRPGSLCELTCVLLSESALCSSVLGRRSLINIISGNQKVMCVVGMFDPFFAQAHKQPRGCGRGQIRLIECPVPKHRVSSPGCHLGPAPVPLQPLTAGEGITHTPSALAPGSPALQSWSSKPLSSTHQCPRVLGIWLLCM